MELRAESECRVEVNPEDVHQESASETGCSSVRSRKSNVSFSQRKNRKLQWVITRVDNGNLHRPRPAYYGPLEEDSSDMDPSDMETSPRVEAYQGGPPTSPGGDLKHVSSATAAEPPSPGGMSHNRMWTPTAAVTATAPAVPQEREEDASRKRRVVEIQSQIEEMQSQIELLRAEQRRLQDQDLQEPPQSIGLGPRNNTNHRFGSIGNGNRMSWDAGSAGPPPPPLNSKSAKGGEYPGNTNEALARYVQQGPLDDPVPYPLGTRLGSGAKAGPSHRATQVEPNQEIGNDTGSMISPPETVASPSGETQAAAAAAAAAAAVGAHPSQDFPKAPSAAPAPPYAGPRERLHTFPPPIQPVRTVNNTTNNSSPANCVSGGRKVAGGLGGKLYRCGYLGCKSTFARNCELRYVLNRGFV